VLEQIVAGRLRRRLTTVIDTLGVDENQRAAWRNAASAAGMRCIGVVFDTPSAECRRRNAARSVPVAADVIGNQLRRWPEIHSSVLAEPWSDVLTPEPVVVVPAALATRRRSPGVAPVAALPRPGVSVGLHLSSFDWPGGRHQLASHLRSIAVDAEAAGVDHIWMMDHLRQIPQIGPAWADMPEPYTALSWLAAVTSRVRLGVLVSPAFRHQPVVLAKQIATLDVLSQGRAMCGLGVGWFAQEYAAAGIDFPTVERRYSHLEDMLQALPLLWGKGSPRFDSPTVTLPETLCYPRPIQEHIPMIMGGSGERRTLRLAARYADGCNLFGEPDVVAKKVAVLARHCEEIGRAIGRDVGEIEVSHLSTVLMGRDHDDLSSAIERLRPKRMGAERFAREVNAGTVVEHYDRAMRLVEAGATTLIVRLVDVADPAAVERLGELIGRVKREG
jgi:alkanesulfonate monooxygenase SsuD/methylene tetrahydromethanopterin reductase-like flavin-dependent oxidoreductase (luciferase family)